MSKVTYHLSLLSKETNQPIRGFTAIVHAWGTGGGVSVGDILFAESPLHAGTDAPLAISLDQVSSGENGVAKLTLRGPISGDPGDPVAYETYVVLRRRASSDVVLTFQDCKGLSAAQRPPLAATQEAFDPHEAALSEDLFTAKEAVDAGNKSQEAKFAATATVLGLRPEHVAPDWYGVSDLTCHTIYARIADLGLPHTGDKTVQLHYPGTPNGVTVPYPLSRSLQSPTVLNARARTGRIWMILRDAVSGVVEQKIWLDVARSQTQEVVLISGNVPQVPNTKEAWLPVPRPLRFLFRGQWYEGNDPVIEHYNSIYNEAADKASHLTSVIPADSQKAAEKAIKDRNPVANNIRAIRFRDVREQVEFTISAHPANPRHWSAFRWAPNTPMHGTWIQTRLFVDDVFVTWD